MPKIKKIHWGNSFKRAYKKRVAGKPDENLFAEHFKLFIEDPFDPILRTHKLSGKLDGLWSFAVSFDCRVIFEFLSATEILLIDIGSHKEVY